MPSDSSTRNKISCCPSSRTPCCLERAHAATMTTSVTKSKPERQYKKRLKEEQCWSCMDDDLTNNEDVIIRPIHNICSASHKNRIHSSQENVTHVSQKDVEYKDSENYYCNNIKKLAINIKHSDSVCIDYSAFSQNKFSRLPHDDDDDDESIYREVSDDIQNQENRKIIELPKCFERQRCVIFRSNSVDLKTDSLQTATTSDMKTDKIDNMKENLRQNTSVPDSEEIRFKQMMIVAPVSNATKHKSNSTPTKTDRSLMQRESETQISNPIDCLNSVDRTNQELSPTSNDGSHYNRLSLNTEGHNSNVSTACTDLSEIRNELEISEPTDAKQCPDLSSEGGVKFHKKQTRRNCMRKTKIPYHDEEDSVVLLQVQGDTLHLPVDNIDQIQTELNFFNTENTVQETRQDQKHLSLQGACGGNPLSIGYGTQETQIVSAEIEVDGIGENMQANSQNPEAVRHSSTSAVQTPPEETTQLQNRRRDVFPDPVVDDSDLQRFEPMMVIIDKIAVGERVAPQITMRYEMLRLCTLRSFPKVNKPFIIRIAQAGFYYANSGDEVVCYCCAKRKSGWQETDVPLDVHRQLSPNCRFLMSNSVVNVSVRRQEILASRQSVSAARVTSPADDIQTEINASAASHRIQNYYSNLDRNSTREVFRRSPAQFGNATASQNSLQALTSSVAAPAPSSTVLLPNSSPTTCLTSTVNTMNTNTVQYNSQATPVRNPKYPAYVTLTTRQASFRDCSELAVPADILAEAGFFYAGFGDCCRCFQCGVGLRHWSAEDDAWIEHARWSRNCSYVREKKGEEFINLVQIAVEYQQNQERSQEEQQSSASRSGERPGSGNRNVDSLLHSDAGQSVLEMGYTPEMIRRAIQIVLDNVSSESNITAALLMEQIFAMEESESSQATDLIPTPQSTPSPAPASEVSTSVALPPQLPATLAPTSNLAPAPSTSEHEAQTSMTSATKPRNHTARNQNNDEVTSPKVEGATAASSRNATRKMTSLEQQKLREENARMNQQTICTKCKQNDVSIVFLPCGHLVTCETCAETVRYCTERNCGKYIKGTVRTYAA